MTRHYYACIYPSGLKCTAMHKGRIVPYRIVRAFTSARSRDEWVRQTATPTKPCVVTAALALSADEKQTAMDALETVGEV